MVLSERARLLGRSSSSRGTDELFRLTILFVDVFPVGIPASGGDVFLQGSICCRLELDSLKLVDDSALRFERDRVESAASCCTP